MCDLHEYTIEPNTYHAVKVEQVREKGKLVSRVAWEVTLCLSCLIKLAGPRVAATNRY